MILTRPPPTPDDLQPSSSSSCRSLSVLLDLLLIFTTCRLCAPVISGGTPAHLREADPLQLRAAGVLTTRSFCNSGKMIYSQNKVLGHSLNRLAERRYFYLADGSFLLSGRKTHWQTHVRSLHSQKSDTFRLREPRLRIQHPRLDDLLVLVLV